jgi:xanthine dehydrogenase YagS FAD-binding subunit
MSELYRLPGDAPERDTSITPGELITAIRITDASRLSSRSTYLKVRDRASFEFAVVSVAAALRIENSVIAEARLAAGSVAPMPWRLGRSEARLIGQKPSDDAFAAAGELAVEGALPLAHNAFKVELLRNSVVRALQTIGGQP